MSVAVGDIVRIVVEMLLLDTEEVVNVFHFEVTTNATLDDTEFMDDIQAYLQSAYQNIDQRMSVELDFVAVKGQNVTQDVLLPATAFDTLAVGTDTTDLLPPQNAVLCYFPTTRPKTRASNYLPGVCEGSIGAQGALNTAALDDYKLWGDDFVGEGGTVDVKLRRVAYNAALARATRVISRVVPTRPRTQRRRRPGVGI